MNTQVTELAQSGTVQANGQALYYEVHGEGPPLVLVMGIGYDSSLWTLEQVPVLSTQFQVILVDNRDAGRSSKARQPYTIADMQTTSPACWTPSVSSTVTCWACPWEE